MFSLIELLSFSQTLATKFVFLNNDPCIVGLFLIDLNFDSL